MKKICLVLLIILLPMIARADFLGLKKADEFVSMRVITLDSSGIRTKPDSVHVFTYLDGGTALQFNTRSTTYPFAIGIDTSKIYGDTTYWFVDQIQDIDGTPTPADYTLTINIVMWGDGGIPTDNWATVQVLGDSLDIYLSEIRDTTFGIIDTLQLQDDWAATLANQTLMIDSLQVVLDSVRATLDTLQNQDNWVLAKADSAEYMNVKSMGGIANTASPVNLDEAFDGDNTGSKMRLTRLEVVDNNDFNPVVLIQNTGNTGIAMEIISDSTHALAITGAKFGGSGAGIKAYGRGSAGIYASDDGGGSGLFASGTGAGHGIRAVGGATGHGLYISGGANSGNAIALSVTSGDLIQDSVVTEGTIKSSTFHNRAFQTNVFDSDQFDETVREEIWNTPFSDAATVAGSMWDSLNNSSYVQGSSGLDSSTLAGWVWNSPQSNHTTAGTFGKYLDAEISGMSIGSGAFSYQIVTYDSTTAQVIPGTNLAVRNINQSALIAVGKSDMLGSETFNLDADSFIIVATSPGYIYQTFDTLIVSGAGIDTVFGDQFDPGSPSSPALCRVYGYLYSVSAIPEKDAVVSAYLPAGAVQSGNLIISPFMVTTSSDSSGYFFLDLIRSDSLVPAATQYDLIIERSDGTIVHKRVTVPDSTSWLLDW